jgi:DNA modification methylase
MTILNGDWIEQLSNLKDCCVQCCITSPPYWGLRDYGVAGQLGLEKTPEEYVEKMVIGFREVKRVLKDDGTLWLNLGDSYWGGKGENGSSKARATADERGYIQSGGTVQMSKRPQDSRHNIIKPKDIVGIPWRVAFALQSDGWYLRQDIIWAKPNPMPESVTDRCTKSHEYIFLLSKSARYYYDFKAIHEKCNWPDGSFSDGKCYLDDTTGLVRKHLNKKWEGSEFRNKRSVWTITTKPYKEAHFATFPEEIPRTCILAGSKKGDTILDPFSGAGTTGVVAEKLDRKYIGIELNQQYIKLAEDRIYNVQPLFAGLE